MRNIANYIIVILLMAIGLFFLGIFFMTMEKKEKRFEEQSFFQKKRLLRKLEKHSWYESLDKYLKEGDYPMGVTIESYIITHGIVLIIAVLMWFQTGNTLGIQICTLIPLYLNLVIFLGVKKRRQQMQIELCNIQDIIYFQDQIGTSQDIILAYAAKVVHEPLKTPLQNFADKYKLKNNLKKALEEFRSTSNLPEFQNLILTLEQKELTGSSQESYRLQSSTLKRNKRLRRKIQRSYKRAKLIIAAIMLFGCYMAFAMVPLLNELFTKNKLLFR